jgi:hypothetical protein
MPFCRLSGVIPMPVLGLSGIQSMSPSLWESEDVLRGGLGLRVLGLGFRILFVLGAWFWVFLGLGLWVFIVCGVQGAGFRVWGLGFRLGVGRRPPLWFGVQDLGFK